MGDNTTDNTGKVLGVYPIFFCYAFFLSMLGQFVPYMQERHGIALGSAGLFSTLQSIGGIVAVLICVVFFDALNKPKVLGLLGLCFAGLMALLGAAPHIWLVFALFLFVGFVSSLINTLSNAVVSDHTMHRRSLFLNLLHGFFGLGGAVGSQVTSAVSSAFDMGQAFLYYSVFSLLCVTLYIWTIRDDFRRPLLAVRASFSDHIVAFKKAAGIKGMGTVAAVSFFNAFFTINILYWTYSFVLGIGRSPVLAALAVTAYFVALTVSRFISALFTRRVGPRGFVAAGSLTGVVFAALASFSGNPAFAILMFGMVGLCTGNNFPQIMAESCTLAPDTTAAASGIMMLGYFLAAVIAPPLIGWIGDMLGLTYGLLINALMLLPAGLLALGFRRNASYR